MKNIPLLNRLGIALLATLPCLLPLSAHAVNLVIIDNGFVDRAGLEAAYCPPEAPTCLQQRVSYWNCSNGSTCTAVKKPSLSLSAHATKVGQVAMDVIRTHEQPSDSSFSLVSVMGSPPPQFFDQFRTQRIVVVNTRGIAPNPGGCANHQLPLDVNYVHAAGNNRTNGFAARSSSPTFLQDQINCVASVSSVAGLGQAVVDFQTGGDCTDGECVAYPLFRNSNFSDLTEFAAQACWPRSDSDPLACNFGSGQSNQGTSFAAPVVAGAYVALHRRAALTIDCAKSILLSNGLQLAFDIETLASPYLGQHHVVRVVDDAAIGTALQAVGSCPP